ncbi:hypothetical protein [Phytohalomonas tamaricis]|uniref:hypothetical protein n=1 Tax=Phytohalomonas tamaricis TaxID=2081032 RepID=UPI00131A17E3|nr:hypothetical protein [Phytohalomonas tamaricis]
MTATARSKRITRIMTGGLACALSIVAQWLSFSALKAWRDDRANPAWRRPASSRA